MQTKNTPAPQANRSFEESGSVFRKLVIVAMVVAMVASVVVTLADRASSPVRLQAAANDLGLEVERTRLKAAELATNARVLFDTHRDAFQVQLQVGDEWQNAGPYQKLPSGVEIVSAQTVQFNPQGIAPAMIELMLADRTGHLQYLRVEMQGGVSVEGLGSL